MAKGINCKRNYEFKTYTRDIGGIIEQVETHGFRTKVVAEQARLTCTIAGNYLNWRK
ncbi:MAG: hypothetical protein QW728_06125 [Thermoplasmata archaeon]